MAESKCTAFILVFLCFILHLTISCATTGGGLQKTADKTITEADIEIISWSFDTGYSHGNFSLFALNAAAAARNPQLYDFINTLLYKEQTLYFSGQTAQEFLDNVKKSSVEWDREFHEENFTWEIRGNYLLLKRIYTGGSGSSYEMVVSYIIDTASVKSLTIDDIIIDSGNPDLQGLVWNRLLQTDNWIAGERAAFYKSLEERAFSIFFDGQNIIFHWDKGLMAANAAGAIEAVLQQSEVFPYLTDIGRELL